MRSLIKGENQQCGAINWQDMGIPAFIAEGRLGDLSGYYIEGQKTPINIERAVVCMEKSSEGRDVLLALSEWNYAGKGWDFEGAVSYRAAIYH